MLQPYGYDYAFTNSIIQDAQAKAKLDIFSSPQDNMKYANNVAWELKDMGHFVELLYFKRSKVLLKLGHVGLAEEDYHCKYDGESPLPSNEHSAFVEKWKKQHTTKLCDQLGLKDGPQIEFLAGILFTPSTTTITVPLLQKVSALGQT